MSSKYRYLYQFCYVHVLQAAIQKSAFVVVSGTATSGNGGGLCLDCDSRRAVGPVKFRAILWLFMTQLNRLERLAVLSAPNERSFYV